MSIQNSVAFHIKHENPNGIKQKDLTKWYLNQIEDEIEKEEEIAAREELFDQVVQRLISREQVLMVLEENKDRSERVLTLHPNFDFF